MSGMPADWKYQLIIQIPIGSTGDFDRMVEAEGRMGEALKGVADVTGHDAGSGEGNIFIHTNTPQSDARIAMDCLPEQVRDHAKAAFRQTEGETYTVLWPPGLKEFRVL